MRMFKKKSFKLIIIFLFVLQGYETFASCDRMRSYDEEITCSKDVFIARNIDQLNDYSTHFGLQNGQYGNLRITFNIRSSGDIDIISPCQVMVRENVSIGLLANNICLDGLTGVQISSNFSSSAIGTFEVLSEKGDIILGRNTILTGGGNNNFIFKAKDFQLKAKSVLQVLKGNLIIHSTGERFTDKVAIGANSVIKAKDISFNAKARISLDKGSRVTAEGMLGMHSYGTEVNITPFANIYLRRNVTISGLTVSLSASNNILMAQQSQMIAESSAHGSALGCYINPTAQITTPISSGNCLMENFNRIPRIRATATPASGLYPLTVIFRASTRDLDRDAVEASWYFDDGNTATGSEVTHVFNTRRGIHKVRAVATDAAGSQEYRIISIDVMENRIPPVASFTSSVSSGFAPLQVSFNGSTSNDPDGDISGYLWDFGDGTQSRVISPPHLYNAPGKYTVLLTVTGNEGLKDTISGIITVNKNPATNKPPVVSVQAPESGYAPFMVNLTAVGNDPDGDSELIGFTWTLPDGTTLTGKEVSFTLSTIGINTISLLARDEDGGMSNTSLTINVLADTTPPLLTTNITEGSSFITQRPVLVFNYSDDESGIKRDSFTLSFDDEDITSRVTRNATEAIMQFTLGFSISDGEHSLTATVKNKQGKKATITRTFTVDTGLISGGMIIGSILDGSTELALSQASVSIEEGPLGTMGDRVTTNETGAFSYLFSVGGTYLLSIGKPGYTTTTRSVVVEANQDYTLGDVLLKKQDSVMKTIGISGGELVNSAGTKVTIDAGTLSEDVDLVVTSFDSTDAFPGDLPELSEFTYAFDFNIRGSFAKPVTVAIPNNFVDTAGNKGFPVGTEVVVGRFDEDLGVWLDSGSNFVVARNNTQRSNGKGARQVLQDPPDSLDSFLEGRIQIPMAHDPNQPSLQPGALFPMMSVASNSPGSYANPSKKKYPSPDKCGCRIDTDSGNLAVDHSSPSVRLLGLNYQLDFSYNSLAAKPHVIGSLSLQGSQVAAATLVSQGVEARFNNGQAEAVLDFKSGSPIFKAQFPGKNHQGEYYPSGLYKMHFKKSNYFTGFYARAAFFGAPAGTLISSLPTDGGPAGSFPTIEPVEFSLEESVNIPIINERKSGFGVGWTLNGLSELRENSEGDVLITDGVGGADTYYPVVNAPTNSNTRTMSRSVNDLRDLKLHYQRGHVYASSCSSNQVFRINSNGSFQLFAGHGKRGFSGDGGSAKKALLSCPRGVAVSLLGDVFIADGGNRRIRKVDQNGIISTHGGNGKVLNYNSNGKDSLEVGIGVPRELWVDELLSVYYTADDTKIMMIDPRGKLRFYADSTAGFIRYNFSSLGNFSESKDGRMLILDKGEGKILEIRPKNFTVHTKVDLNSPESDGNSSRTDSPYRSVEATRYKAMAYDKRKGMFYLLKEDGGLSAWRGNHFQRKQELVVSEGRLQMENGSRSNEIEETSSKARGVSSSTINSIAFSPELGVIVATDAEVLGGFDSGTARTRQALPPNQIMTEYMTENLDKSRLVKFVSGKYQRTFPDGAIESYTAKGLLESRMTPEQRQMFYHRNESGNLDRLQFSTGDFFGFHYDARGYLTHFIDPAGRRTNFTIDNSGNLTKITNPDSSHKSYIYDGDHLLTSETKENGETERYAYKYSRVISQELPGGRTNTIAPRTLVGLSDETVAGSFLADKTIFPSRGGDCNTSYEYQKGHSLITDCLGGVTTYNLNSFGFPIEIITPEGRKIKQQVTDRNLVTRREDADGVTTFQYETQFDYISKETDALGHFNQYTYNTAGRLTLFRDKRNNSISYSYNARHFPTSMTDQTGAQTLYAYDDEYNLSSMTSPNGNTTTYARDRAGNVNSITNPRGHKTLLEHDTMGRLIKTTDALSNITKFTYHPGGDPKSVIDANSNTTSYEYNTMGLLSKTTHPDNTFRTYTYDDNERLSSMVQEDGSTISRSYDLLGRSIEFRTSDNTTMFSYDADSLVTQVTNDDAQIDKTYDNLTRLIKEKTTYDNFLHTMDYTYDERGYLKSVIYSNANHPETPGRPTVGTIRYERNENGQITGISAQFKGKSFNWQRTLNARGQPTKDLMTGMQRTTYTYDTGGRLDSLSNLNRNSAIISKFVYGYDKNSNITSLTRSRGAYGNLRAGSRDLSFTYDNLDRLKTSDLDRESFSYDAVGSFTGSSYTTNSRNQMTSTPLETITYDTRGNTTSISNAKENERIDLTWMVKGLMESATIHDGGVKVQEVTSFYNGEGRRVKKQVTHFTRPKLSYTRQYIYHNEDILAELDGNNNLVAFYIHGPGIDTPLAMMRDRNLDGIIKNNEVFVYTRDHQSSVRELTDLNGVVVQRYDYTAYGETTVELNGEVGDRLIENPYGYTGRVLDRETGCYYYRARFYCPSLRQFLSPDPLGFDNEVYNQYSYASNNPISFIDPYGLTSYPTERPLETKGYFGPRKSHPTTKKKNKFHYGTDFSQKNTSGSVYAVESGRVIRVGPVNGNNRIQIEDAEGTVHGYYHTTTTLKVGDKVEEGMKIGNSDLSGRTTGLHLHYSVQPKGSARVDSLKYLKARNPSTPKRPPKPICGF